MPSVATTMSKTFNLSGWSKCLLTMQFKQCNFYFLFHSYCIINVFLATEQILEALVAYVPHCLFLCLFCFSVQRRKQSRRVSRHFSTYLTRSLVAVDSDAAKLPAVVLVHDSLQSPVRWCRAWSSSAWWPFWVFLPSFGSSTKGEIPACLLSRRLSTTLRSGSWRRISPAWWRLRRLTARHRTVTPL